jgi:hypothetical protein
MRNVRYFPLLLLLCRVPLAHAQGVFNVAIGFGSAHDTSNGQGIDNLNSANALMSCTPGSTDTNCEATPSLGGLFMGLTADGMLNKHFGIGGEWTFQPGHPNYGPLQYRQMFYDFNGIYAPVFKKIVILQLQGGIGGSHTGFSIQQSQCVGTAVCNSFSQSIGTTNHFQEHAGVGVEVLLTQHIFIRPQFDYHHVTGFTGQFGRDNVFDGMVWLGYNWGEP